MYFLFAGDVHLAQGGARDCKGVFEDKEQAEDALNRAVSHAGQHDWAHLAIVKDGNLHIVMQKTRQRF